MCVRESSPLAALGRERAQRAREKRDIYIYIYIERERQKEDTPYSLQAAPSEPLTNRLVKGLGKSSVARDVLLCTGGAGCDPKGSMAFLQNQFRCPPVLGARRTSRT